jgi:ABC-type methionine transport system permease subunit
MKLPPKRVLSFTWSWFWRSLVYTLMVTVAAMIIAFGAGFLAGIIFIFASPNDSAKQIFLQAIGMLIGGMVGFGSLPFFLQWMTTHRLGKFRLLLLVDESKDVK